ncbi:Scr1 family TA system antitoxin-like transcriptional regulator [Streptomyces sp. NEAU-H22]|uniref:helix-turn-helix domain-containing protein n=2 Tax=unclassified Streptomyces TaxID=2593676 RepID=UPI00224C9472|nr:Scr1 family TA system antitoxin-like transcriptional regulator [Streptomyces sp. NEAU-H22]MCX3286616.1 Scr1 family TA system antitoxin-like transcriptional regulator [Streptomyces sp. NEAU-H22]
MGAELRHAREKAGLSQEDLGQRLFVSGSFIGQLEAGTRRLQREYARLLDEVLGTEDFFQRNCAAAAKSKYREHFAEAAEVETQAAAIREYTSMLIPGLLQTPAYARAVSRAYQPSAAEEAIEALVTGRMERARILHDPTKPLLWTVIDEAALRRATGGPEVMAGALRHLIGLIRRNRVSTTMRNTPEWYKSSYSGGTGDNCLEVTQAFPDVVPVRDSKAPHGPKLVFRATAWSAFVENLKDETA